MFRTALLTGLASATLVSCGGGGPAAGTASDDASPAATAQTDPGGGAAGSPTGSAACFNEGLLRAGSTVDFVLKISGSNSAAPPRRIVSTVRGPKQFNGLQTIETEAAFYGDGGQRAGSTLSYSALEDGVLLTFGQKGDAFVTYSPPRRQLIKMTPGKADAQSFQTRKQYPDHTEAGMSEESRTYVGREAVTSAVGNHEACKFISHYSEKSAAGSIGVTDKTTWVFAEGPYRGLEVRTDATSHYPQMGQTIVQRIEVTKVDVFDMR